MSRLVDVDILRRRIAFDQHFRWWDSLRHSQFWAQFIHAPTIAASADLAQQAPRRARRRRAS